MINPITIEKILDAADIGEVVGEYVTLKRRGVNLMGNCPFHNEKTPSFVVSPTKGIFKCFGCGKAGNSAGFIMEHNGLTYPEALRWLANKYNIEIEEEKYNKDEVQKQKTDREALLVAVSVANKYFMDLLHNDPEGQAIGKAYFLERGLRDDTISRFELGYAKKDWNHFYNYAIKSGLEAGILEKAGLIKKRESDEPESEAKYYDMYRERVTFPIHDITGKVIAFGARQLKKDDRSPKYINSPENEIYHKSRVLYGLFQAKKAIREKDSCYLTEGYLDVITLHQNGIENAIASSGTSLTQDQVKLISRFTDNITVLYDGDQAGLKAAMRGTDIILENNLNVRIVVFPEGEDPDSYCKKVGGEAFEQYIKDTQTDFILFKTNTLLCESEGDPIKKAMVIREVVESIAKIPDPIKRSVFIKQTSVLLDTDETILVSETNRLRLKGNEKAVKQIDTNLEELFIHEEGISLKQNPTNDFREKAILRAIILYGNLPLNEDTTLIKFIINEIEEDSLEFINKEYNEIIEQAKSFFNQNGFVDEYFFRNNEATMHLASDIILDSQKHMLSPGWLANADKVVKTDLDNYKEDVVSNINYLKLEHIKRLRMANQQKIREEKSPDLLISLMEYDMKLKSLHSELSALLGISYI